MQEKTRISDCSCVHADQDAMYGKGMRVFNPAFGKSGANKNRHRCTVCKKEKDIKVDD